MKTAEEMLKEKGGEMFCVSKDTTVFDALSEMCSKGFGAVPGYQKPGCTQVLLQL